MLTIKTYAVSPTVNIHSKAQVLHLGVLARKPTFWALVDTESPVEPVAIHVAIDNEKIPESCVEDGHGHLGSYEAVGTMYHLFGPLRLKSKVVAS